MDMHDALRTGTVISKEQHKVVCDENHNLRALVRALYAETQGQEVSITRPLWELLDSITKAAENVSRLSS